MMTAWCGVAVAAGAAGKEKELWAQQRGEARDLPMTVP